MSITRLVGVVLLVHLNGWAQAQTSLSFSEPHNKIDPRLEFEVNDNAFQKIHSISGEKLEVNPHQIRFDGQPLSIQSCKIRGKTTLLFRRKSFSLSLKDPVKFQDSPVKRLAVNNLAMDRNYWRTRLCFLLMKKIGIFPLRNQYTELIINGETQGTYLMIQKPEDYIRHLGSKLLVRREGVQGLRIEYARDSKFKKSLKQLKKAKDLAGVYSDKLLYDTLNQIIDLKSYSKWLGFNYLIMNGDYTDELFLYIHPEYNKFLILPWDYDDVFASEPHEGQKRRDHLLGNQLLFSSEASFDLMIANDEYLYREYLETFGEILTIFTPEVIKNTFERVFRELYPFFSNSEVIAQSRYDHYGLTTLELLKEDLATHYHFLLSRRNSMEIALMINH